MAVTWVGQMTRHEASSGFAGTGGTFTPSGVLADDWLVMVLTNVTNTGDTTSTVTYTLPGWTRLADPYMTGSIITQVWARKRLSADTGYELTLSSPRLWMASMFYVRGTTLPIVQGTRKWRGDDPASDTVNLAPSVTSRFAGDLTVAWSAERTTTSEGTSPTVSGATLRNYQAQTSGNSTTIMLASADVVANGSTPSISFTYPNAQASNGIAQQLVFPNPDTPVVVGQRLLDLDGVADNTTLTTSATSVGPGDTPPNAVGGSPRIVSEEIVVDNVSTIKYARWNNLGTGDWSTRFYGRWAGATTATSHYLTAFDAAGSRIWSLSTDSSNRIQARNATTAVLTSPVKTQVGKYRHELYQSDGVDGITIRIFNPDGTPFWSPSLAALGSTARPASLQYGRQSSTLYGTDFFLSHLAFREEAGLVGAHPDEIPGEEEPPNSDITYVGDASTASDLGSNTTSGGTITVPTSGTTGIASGDWIYAILINITDPGDTTSSTTMAPSGSGWTLDKTASITGSFVHRVYRKLYTGGSADVSITLTSPRLWMAAAFWVRGASATDIPLHGTRTNRTVDMVNTATGVANAKFRDLIVAWSVERTTTAEATTPTVTGATRKLYRAQTAANSTTIMTAVTAAASAGTTSDITFTYPNSHTVNGVAAQIVFTVPVTTVGANLWSGTSKTPVNLYLWNGSQRLPINTLEYHTGTYTFDDLMANDMIAISHRGGKDVWPEHTARAYMGSVVYGMQALELNVHRTSDGIWVIHHDTTTTRMTGATHTIRSTPWSTLSGLTVSAADTFNTAQPTGGIPLLSDIVAAYGQTHVLFIEARDTADTGVETALLDYLDTLGSWRTDHIVFKSSVTRSTALASAKSRGYHTYAYAGASNLGSIATYAASADIDLLGVSVSMTDTEIETVVNAANANNKRTISTSCASVVEYNALRDLGVTGTMVSHPYNVLPKFGTPTFPPEEEPPPPPTGQRVAYLHPWASESVHNISIGSGAIFDAASDPKTNAMLNAPSGVGIGINHTNWSIQIAQAVNTDPMMTLQVVNSSGTPTGVTYQLRVPTWVEATSGTDRHVGVVQPDGYTLYEMYKFLRTSSTTITSTYVNINDLRGDGLQRGSRASGISFLTGLIRTHEINDLNIPHVLCLGIPASMMMLTPLQGYTASTDGFVRDANSGGKCVWPSRLIDTQVGSNIYTASQATGAAMGSMWGIPSTVNLDNLGLTPEGLALGRAMQRYGMYVLVQAAHRVVFVEPNADGTKVSRMRTDFQTKLFPLVRRLRNNNPTSITNGTPSTYSLVAGGGTRPYPLPPELGTVVTPPPPTTTTTSTDRVAWKHPFHEDAMWNTSKGSGLAYVPTSDPQHQQLIVSGGAVLSTSWADPVYLATSSDPTFTIRHVDYLPANWDLLSNTDLGPASPSGPLVKEYYNVHVPAEAKWFGTSNEDRKCFIVQPAWDGEPAGTVSIEMQKFYRTTTPGLILCTHLTRNDIRAYGLNQGAIASAISPTGGLIRTWEIAAAKAGDVRAIQHIVRVGISNARLMPGLLWPARSTDWNTDQFVGLTKYGTHISLPDTVDVEALRYNGLPLASEGKALAYAMQDYGGYVLIRAGSDTSTGIMLTVEGRDQDAAALANMLDAYRAFLPYLRISTEATANDVGTLDADRMPTDLNQILGGGTRRRPKAKSLDSTPTAQVAAWGDSLTASTGTDWPGTTLETLLGIPVNNMGVSGMGTMDIGLRQGGVVPRITVANNTIPASGSVAVTAVSPPTGWRINGTGSFTWTGILSGVAGTLSHDLVANTWTFTRTSSGYAMPCPAGTEFFSNSLLTNHERMISVFWTGRNSLDALSRIPEATAAMVAKLVTNPKRFVVLSMTNTSSETQGSTNYTNILAMNAGLASTYPSNYIDIRDYLASAQALADAGITPTTQDNLDLANDVIPTSLRTDSTHLNAAGYTRVAHKVAQFIQSKGWA